MFKDKKKIEQEKQLFLKLTKELYKNLKNWKDFKPIRGIIEDVFKVAKDAFGLGQFHSYTPKSMMKNIYLCVLLTTLVIQQGYKTKTHLQKLAEGIIEPNTTKNKKTKKTKKNKQKKKNKKVGNKTRQQTLLITSKEQQTNLEYYGLI